MVDENTVQHAKLIVASSTLEAILQSNRRSELTEAQILALKSQLVQENATRQQHLALLVQLGINMGLKLVEETEQGLVLAGNAPELLGLTSGELPEQLKLKGPADDTVVCKIDELSFLIAKIAVRFVSEGRESFTYGQVVRELPGYDRMHWPSFTSRNNQTVSEASLVNDVDKKYTARRFNREMATTYHYLTLMREGKLGKPSAMLQDAYDLFASDDEKWRIFERAMDQLHVTYHG